jgi:hypothetical protein
MNVYVLMDKAEKADIWLSPKVALLWEPFYVGKANNVESRLLTHVFRPHNKELYERLTGVEELEVCVIPFSSEEKAYDFEARLIPYLGRKDLKEGPLLNKSNGGEGVVHPSFASIQKRRLRLSVARSAYLSKLATQFPDEYASYLKRLHSGLNRYYRNVSATALSKRAQASVVTRRASGMDVVSATNRRKTLRNKYITKYADLLRPLKGTFEADGSSWLFTDLGNFWCKNHGSIIQSSLMTRRNLVKNGSPCSKCIHEGAIRANSSSTLARYEAIYSSLLSKYSDKISYQQGYCGINVPCGHHLSSGRTLSLTPREVLDSIGKRVGLYLTVWGKSL